MKTHWRYDWQRAAWIAADDETRTWLKMVVDPPPVVIQIDNIATLYRHGRPPVTYRTDASTLRH